LNAKRKLAERTLVSWRARPDGVGGGERPRRTKGNAIIITKQVSGSAKIDPIDGGVQRYRVDVDQPLVASSIDICDLVQVIQVDLLVQTNVRQRPSS
jgi:hypothetical protein